MRSVTSLLFVALLIVLLLSATPAQEKQGDSAADVAKIETTYDSANDRTTLRFSQWPLAELQDERILLDAEGWYSGRIARQPGNDIRLKITSISSNGYKYAQPVSLTITVGGHRFQPWQMTELSRNVVSREYVQTMEGMVDFSEFFTVAQTNNVKMELNQSFRCLN